MKYAIILLTLAVNLSASAESIGLHVNPARGLTDAQCNYILGAYKGVKTPKLSFLWKTFDRGAGKCPARFVEKFKDREHWLFIYLTNETCRRAPRFCETGREIGAHYRYPEMSRRLQRRDAKLLSQLRRRASAISRYVSTILASNTKIAIVYGLEDDWTNAAYKVVKETVDPLLPDNAIKIRNPNAKDAKGRALYGADFIELHPLESDFRDAPCVFSNDGVDVDLGGSYRPLHDPLSVSTMLGVLGEAKRSCNHGFLWWNNQAVGDKFIRPSRRNFRVNREDSVVINSILRRLEK